MTHLNEYTSTFNYTKWSVGNISMLLKEDVIASHVS